MSFSCSALGPAVAEALRRRGAHPWMERAGEILVNTSSDAAPDGADEERSSRSATLFLIDFAVMKGNIGVQGGRRVPEPVAPACHLEQARAPGASQLRFRGERPGRADDAGCVDMAHVERPVCAPPLCLPCAHTVPGARSRPTWGPERQEGGRGGGGVREDLLLRPRPAWRNSWLWPVPPSGHRLRQKPR